MERYEEENLWSWQGRSSKYCTNDPSKNALCHPVQKIVGTTRIQEDGRQDFLRDSCLESSAWSASVRGLGHHKNIQGSQATVFMDPSPFSLARTSCLVSLLLPTSLKSQLAWALPRAHCLQGDSFISGYVWLDISLLFPEKRVHIIVLLGWTTGSSSFQNASHQ